MRSHTSRLGSSTSLALLLVLAVPAAGLAQRAGRGHRNGGERSHRAEARTETRSVQRRGMRDAGPRLAPAHVRAGIPDAGPRLAPGPGVAQQRAWRVVSRPGWQGVPERGVRRAGRGGAVIGQVGRNAVGRGRVDGGRVDGGRDGAAYGNGRWEPARPIRVERHWRAPGRPTNGSPYVVTRSGEQGRTKVIDVLADGPGWHLARPAGGARGRAIERAPERGFHRGVPGPDQPDRLHRGEPGRGRDGFGRGHEGLPVRVRRPFLYRTYRPLFFRAPWRGFGGYGYCSAALPPYGWGWNRGVGFDADRFGLGLSFGWGEPFGWRFGAALSFGYGYPGWGFPVGAPCGGLGLYGGYYGPYDGYYGSYDGDYGPYGGTLGISVVPAARCARVAVVTESGDDYYVDMDLPYHGAYTFEGTRLAIQRELQTRSAVVLRGRDGVKLELVPAFVRDVAVGDCR